MDIPTIMREYGVSIREAEYIQEYLKESGLDDDLMIPVVVSNVRGLMSRLDKVFSKSYTLREMASDYHRLPQSIRDEYGDKYLLASVDMFVGEPI